MKRLPYVAALAAWLVAASAMGASGGSPSPNTLRVTPPIYRCANAGLFDGLGQPVVIDPMGQRVVIDGLGQPVGIHALGPPVGKAINRAAGGQRNIGAVEEGQHQVRVGMAIGVAVLPWSPADHAECERLGGNRAADNRADSPTVGS